MKKSKAEYILFERYIISLGIDISKEVPLSKLITGFKHKYRSDYILKKNGKTLILEVEGGNFTGGRHTNGVGYWNDTIKYNALTLSGYVLVRFTAILVNQNPVQCADLLNAYFNDDINFYIMLNSFTEKHKIKAKRRMKKQ